MKKTVRNILIMAAVLLVLGGIAAWLLLCPPQGEEGEASSSEISSSSAAEIVMDREAEEVSSISVKNKEGSFTLVPDGENFAIEGYEDCDVNVPQITSSAACVLSISSIKNLGSRDDLESFGLSGENSVSVEIKYRDGTADSLVLGGTAAETSGRYVLKDDTVYIAAGISDLLYGDQFGYFHTDLYTVPDRTESVEDEDGNTTVQTAADILYSMKLSGSNFPEPIELKYDNSKTSSYLITSPIVAEANIDVITSMAEGLKSLSADGVAAVRVASEDLAEYGLEEPFAKIEFDLNETAHTLTVSKADPDGNCFLLFDDEDTVYEIGEEKLTSWTDITLMQLRMSYLWMPNIMNVETLQATVEGDMAYRFDATKVKNEEKSTEDNPSYDLTVKNADGKDIAYESYQVFYKTLLSVAAISTDKPEYGGQPVLRIEYSYFDGSDSDVLEFYPSGDRYAAVLNGGFTGVARKSEVDKVISLLPGLNENETLSQGN